jgi:UDP:flavonoid glycosyltransferase YjiC (YdhE family)
MWGAKSVPQTKVILLVDLVITHGGYNTITESFYFGKRVLVLPLFEDQWDNGQRIYETGL